MFIYGLHNLLTKYSYNKISVIKLYKRNIRNTNTNNNIFLLPK